MAPKPDDDPVTAEYDVYITPALEEQIFLLTYPNRPRTRPYSQTAGATPSDMRIKPHSGYLEMDVKLSADLNFNKVRGLQWGEAVRASKQLHNSSGTFGLAAGLAPGRPKASGARVALQDRYDRDSEARANLENFKQMELEGKVLDKQTLGGQIMRHGVTRSDTNPHYFVGAFDGDRLHLTELTGTVMMRPQFHHLDAEEERNRVAAARSQAEANDGGPAPVARALQARFMQEDERGSLEAQMRKALQMAEQEQWIEMEYVDEEEDEAFQAYREKLFTSEANVDTAADLKSRIDNDAWLDAYGCGRESPSRRRKRASRRKDIVDLDADEENGDEEEAHDPEQDDTSMTL